MKTLLVGYKVQDLFEVNRRGERRPVPWLDGDITCHTLDIYHCHAIENSSCGVKAVCSPHLPKDNWDLIKFKTGPKLMSGELSLDLLQEIRASFRSISFRRYTYFTPSALNLSSTVASATETIFLQRSRTIRIVCATFPPSGPRASQAGKSSCSRVSLAVSAIAA